MECISSARFDSNFMLQTNTCVRNPSRIYKFSNHFHHSYTNHKTYFFFFFLFFSSIDCLFVCLFCLWRMRNKHLTILLNFSTYKNQTTNLYKKEMLSLLIITCTFHTCLPTLKKNAMQREMQTERDKERACVDNAFHSDNYCFLLYKSHTKIFVLNKANFDLFIEMCDWIKKKKKKRHKWCIQLYIFIINIEAETSVSVSVLTLYGNVTRRFHRFCLFLSIFFLLLFLILLCLFISLLLLPLL